MAVGEVDPAGQKYPAVHEPEQADDVMPCVDPNRPAPQGLHALLPATLYFPSLQMVATGVMEPAAQEYLDNIW
jgi:hypothetical protein